MVAVVCERGHGLFHAHTRLFDGLQGLARRSLIAVMKTSPPDKTARALTQIEALVLLAVFVMSAVIFLRVLAISKPPRKPITCANNLKQISFAFRVWANDNADRFPMQVLLADGGTMELVPSGNVFPHFQAMSNELSIPKLLVCPQDRERSPATNFTSDFNDTRISYFVGVDAEPGRPEMFLTGDRNIMVGRVQLPHGLTALGTNSAAGWSRKIHKYRGHVALCDGSVNAVDNQGLRKLLAQSGVTNRLAIP